MSNYTWNFCVIAVDIHSAICPEISLATSSEISLSISCAMYFEILLEVYEVIFFEYFEIMGPRIFSKNCLKKRNGRANPSRRKKSNKLHKQLHIIFWINKEEKLIGNFCAWMNIGHSTLEKSLQQVLDEPLLNY